VGSHSALAVVLEEAAEPRARQRQLPGKPPVHTGLYLDLIVLTKSLEQSIQVASTQLERIENYNSTRVKDGRFLFGHGIVDEGRGGIFILDVSNAQPHSAADFVVHQLTQMLEFW
jgi:hypothetical protein